ncbi:MAG: efflux RND transporter permease subunit [Thermodesulfobacteriota bacterium]
MLISDTAVRKRVTVLVLALIIIIFGSYCYQSLPRESSPDITIPYVFVSTKYRGVSATDMESSVTMELEKNLQGLEGIKEIKSVSGEGFSSIAMEFLTSSDINQALQDVKDKVDETMGDLPDDLDNDPAVFEVNFSEMPILTFSLAGDCGLSCLKEIADRLEDDIEAIPGVLDVVVTGGVEREIRVELLADKMAHYGLTFLNLQNVVTQENQNSSGGAVRLGTGRFQLRVPGEFTNPDEIYNLVVGTNQGEPVYLKDVARVEDGHKEEMSRSRLDGRQAVAIAVKKRSGENIIAISDRVEELLASRSPAWPAGTQITKIMDQATEIRQMVADLENNILTGLLLVVVVIFFTMGLRNAILVSLAIPFSMLLSFTTLYLMGVTLNMVVLFSLTLALGMLVDNAIVIIENIYRFMEQGMERRQAAMAATSEVAWPVIGSTITTLGAFSPMLFWPGIMGEFMSYLPLTLIVTLTSSLFVALVINPALASYFVKVKDGKTTGRAEAGPEKPVAIEGPLLTSYSRLLGHCLRRPLITLLGAVALLIIMVQGWLLVIGLEKPVEFFPDIDPKAIYVNVDPPDGAGLDYIDQLMKRAEIAICGADPWSRPLEPAYEQAVKAKEHELADGSKRAGASDLANIKNIYTKAVIGGSGSSRFEANDPNHIGVKMVDLEKRVRSSHATMAEIRARLANLAGAKFTLAVQEEGPPTGPPINIEISGENFQLLSRLSDQVQRAISRIPHVQDVRDDFVAGTPTVRVRVDRQKAALFGLTTSMIGQALKTAYNGLDVSSFREGSKDYDITVQLPEDDRMGLNVLRELLIPTPAGELIPLSTLSRIEVGGSIGDISRIDSERVITVSAGVDETRIPGSVARAAAQELLADLPLPPGYGLKFSGEYENQQESQDFLGKAFVVALLIIFLVLVSQFNSVVKPFIIMTSVLLSLGGAFFGLLLFRQPFGVIMTGVGVISLAGVVVNNGIVLVDYISQLQERGLSLRQAVMAGGATRLRPVLLTAVTTILGLIPMVTGISFDFHLLTISWVSESSQWWRSMAVVVIFGLMVATFLTLLVVPSLYYLLDGLGKGAEEKP